MSQAFLPVLVVLTSASAYLIGTRRLGLPGGSLGGAITKMLDCVGITLSFFVVNLAAGAIIILAARTSTRVFVPLYLADDVTLLVLSCIQGLIFQWWREA